MLVKAVLPATFTGFFAAVMVGAVLSTFNSVLNSAATLFSKGIYNTIIRPDANDRQQVAVGRWCSAALAAAAILIAPQIDTTGSLYIYLQQINATFFGPMLAVILGGFLTLRVTAAAAKAGLIGGPVIFYLLNFTFGPEYQSFAQALFGLDGELHFLHTLALVFLLTLLMMFAISSVRPAAAGSLPIKQARESLDLTPWRFARVASAGIAASVFLTYIALAQ